MKYDEIFHEYRQYCHEPRASGNTSTSEMTPYFTITKCNKLLTRKIVPITGRDS